MRTQLIPLFMVVVIIMLSACGSPDDPTKSSGVDPNEVLMRWEKIGLTIDIPWKKSNFPSDAYTYIAQARAHVGSTGSSGFKTEIEGEILGHAASKAHTISVGLEIWNANSEATGVELAIKTIKSIFGDTADKKHVPEEVIEAFRSGQALTHGDWEVSDESTDKLKEIRVYYRPGSSGGESGS